MNYRVASLLNKNVLIGKEKGTLTKRYMDIMTGDNCRQFRLITWTLFIGQFVHPLGGEGIGEKRVDGRIFI